VEARAVTLRFPDGNYQVIVGRNVPDVGQKMRIQGKDWSVAAVTRGVRIEVKLEPAKLPSVSDR
jgi:hypothetical protein